MGPAVGTLVTYHVNSAYQTVAADEPRGSNQLTAIDKVYIGSLPNALTTIRMNNKLVTMDRTPAE